MYRRWCNKKKTLSAESVFFCYAFFTNFFVFCHTKNTAPLRAGGGDAAARRVLFVPEAAMVLASAHARREMRCRFRPFPQKIFLFPLDNALHMSYNNSVIILLHRAQECRQKVRKGARDQAR